MTLHDGLQISYQTAKDSIKKAVERGLSNLLVREKVEADTGLVYSRCDTITGQPLTHSAVRPDAFALHALILAKHSGCSASTQQADSIGVLIGRVVKRIAVTAIQYTPLTQYGYDGSTSIGQSDTGEFMMALGASILWEE
jgi:hypothetical protein